MRKLLLYSFVAVLGVLVVLTNKESSQAKVFKKDYQRKEATPFVKQLWTAQYDGLIRKHRGKVVVVNFWFRGCIPCEKLMPHLVALQKQYGPGRLAVITINPIDEKDWRAHAVKYLKDQNFALQHFVMHDRDTPEAWEKALQVEMFPTTIIYDTGGKCMARFEGEQLEDLRGALAKLFAKK